MCEKAGIERVTAAGSRAGGRTDLGAGGVLDSVSTTLGRWGSAQAGRPYARQANRLLHHVVKALGIKRPPPQPIDEEARPPAAKKRRG